MLAMLLSACIFSCNPGARRALWSIKKVDETLEKSAYKTSPNFNQDFLAQAD